MNRYLRCLPLLGLAPLAHFFGFYLAGRGVLETGLGMFIGGLALFPLILGVGLIFGFIAPSSSNFVRYCSCIAATVTQFVLAFTLPGGARAEVMGVAHRLKREFPIAQLSICANICSQSIAPGLQPFFIGDGLTSSGAAQQVIAPVGATRLFLGVMDQYLWSDNEGGFKVHITRARSTPKIQLALPPPPTPAPRRPFPVSRQTPPRRFMSGSSAPPLQNSRLSPPLNWSGPLRPAASTSFNGPRPSIHRSGSILVRPFPAPVANFQPSTRPKCTHAAFTVSRCAISPETLRSADGPHRQDRPQAKALRTSI